MPSERGFGLPAAMSAAVGSLTAIRYGRSLPEWTRSATPGGFQVRYFDHRANRVVRRGAQVSGDSQHR